VRTAMCVPMWISERIRAAEGRSHPARRWTTMNAAPIPAWAITVPHAEPASPQPKP
jgi:hypothetical protein